MKRVLLMTISVIVVCVIIGCNSKNGQSTEAAQSDSIKVDSVEKQASANNGDSLKAELERADIEDLDGAIEGFFTDVFNERYYEDEGFIKKYCTDNLQKKLKDAYEYDGEEGYATWKFRSDAQDGPSNEYKLTKFIPEGNGWYKYEFIDMGVRGSHRIKVITQVTPRGQVDFYIDELN